MIVGVPLFAVIYDVIKKLVIHGLQRHQELTLLNSYHDQFGDPQTMQPHSPLHRNLLRTSKPFLPRIRTLPMRVFFNQSINRTIEVKAYE